MWTTAHTRKRLFLSTLSLRRATAAGQRGRRHAAISIHALLAESDLRPPVKLNQVQDFYPRSPCGERQPLRMYHRVDREFLSTLSLRRATGKVKVVEPGLVFLSTLSLRRATVEEVSGDTWTRDFYPRSPCGERRQNIRSPQARPHFYPRSPCGERRDKDQVVKCLAHISIHALLAESDLFKGDHGHISGDISIHALLAESDHGQGTLHSGTLRHFYPRSPCGERPSLGDLLQSPNTISIHALLAESDP